MEYTKKEFLANLFTVLNTTQLDYFVVGEYRNLPDDIGDNELGIMINPKDVPEFFELLTSILKQFNANIVSSYENSNVLFYRLYCKNNSCWGLQLDLYCKGCFYQTNEFFPTDEIKNDILVYRGIKVLEVRKAHLIAFLKDIVHKGYSSEKYTNAFIEEVSSNELKYRILFKKLYGSLFVEILFNNLSTGKLKVKNVKLGKLIHTSINHGHFAIFEYLCFKIQFLKRAFRKPGYTIAFLGTDGSGKTTIIDKIVPLLNQAFHNSVYYEHLRPNLIPRIAVLLGKNMDLNNPDYDPHSKKQSGIVGSILRFNYYMIDYVVGYWLKVYPQKAFQSCVWIFDRYYYEYFIDPCRTRVSLPKWVYTVGLISIPKPDLIICLGALPEIIRDRKPEMSLLEIDRQVNELSEFYKKHKNTVWIDTNNSVDESVKSVMNAIFHLMNDRFKSLKLQ